MRLPQALAGFNRYVTNPIQRLWAGKVPAMAIVEHVGRRSGTAYRTPVNLHRTADGFAVVLYYGPDRDWVRNLRAAGGGTLVHRGHRLDVVQPRVLPAGDALEALPEPAAKLVIRLGVDFVLLLKHPPAAG